MSGATREPPVLFAFHHAGGSTASFLGWRKALGPQWCVKPVQLPPRTAGTDLASLVGDLDAGLPAPPGGRHVFYGHSMGALIAYALALRRRQRRAVLPSRLIVSGYPAPDLPPPAVDAALQASDRALVTALLDGPDLSGGMPAASAAVRRLAEAVRMDLRLLGTYQHAQPDRLPIPIDVLRGAQDPLVDEPAARGWDRHTVHRVAVRNLPGGHFFPRQSPDAFFQHLRTLLAAAL